MGKSKRYTGSNKKEKDELEREERILRQLSGQRMPTAPPGYFHDTGEKQRGRRNRKSEKSRLRDAVKEFNNGG